ncbi:MAG: hypothetical protein ABNH53_11415 [Henriciella sp.]|jgi:hypothetical protein
MTNRTIEIVSFKLNDGVIDEDFIAAAHAITDFAKSCDGFITRNLSKNDDGSWVDYIEWASLDAAKAASEKNNQQESLGPVMSILDGSTVKMQHNTLEISA